MICGAANSGPPFEPPAVPSSCFAALDLKLDKLPKMALAADIVYIPLETPFLAAARKRGNRTINGLGMLLHQARPQFQAWFGGSLPEVTPAMRHAVGADLGA